MRHASALRILSIGFGTAVVFLSSDDLRVGASSTSQAEAVADLTARIASCRIHPCLGDSPKDVRARLGGRIVSDGYFEYSDLGVAYPSASDALQGVVEWDIDGDLSSVDLIIVNFPDTQSVLRRELESSLPDCVLKGDEQDSAETGDGDEPTTKDLECKTDQDEDGDVDITVHFATETLKIEIE